jgi:hypothetical protein
MVDKPWTSGGDYVASDHACLFGLGCAGSPTPVRCGLTGARNGKAIVHNEGYGPVFGGGNDFYIHSNANTNTSSFTNLGNTYTLPAGGGRTTFFTGAQHFQPAEYEVFAIDPSA